MLAEATGETLTSNRIDIYLQSIDDLNYELLCLKLEKALQTCKWFPKIPEIREMVIGPANNEASVAEIQAEEAWAKAMRYADLWHPDIGPMRGCPGLTEREEQALRSIGGPLAIQESSMKSLAFLKKDFIACWKSSAHFDEFPALESNERKQLGSGFEPIGQIIKRRTQ